MRNKLYILLFWLSCTMSHSQGSFFKGIGVFLAGTESAHTYKNSDQDKRYINPDSPTNFSPNAYYPRNHTSREYFNWGFGVFAEFSKRENIRWHTEFEYVKKGASEKELIDPFFGTRAGSYSVNKYTYIEWNNYLKFYNPIGMRAHWYFMAGIRLQYLFSSSISAYAPYSSFGTIGFSGDAALGYEFPITKRWSGFTEFHWNPDIIRHKTNSTKVRNRTYELRIGVVYRPRQKRIDDCNAPRYKGPAY